MLPQRGLTALVLFFHWGSVLAPDAPSGLYVLHVFAAATGWQNRLFCLRRWIYVCKYGLSAHVMQFLKGHGGKSVHFAPPWMKVNPSVGSLRLVVPLLPQIMTLRAAFTSSTYLLPQQGGQNRLFCLRRWIHVCKYGPSAHVKLFLSCHGGRSGLFAPVVLH